MNIHRIRCGVLKNNNYIIEEKGHCLIVDLTNFYAMDEFIKEKKLKVDGILLTHSHWDHLLGVDEFIKKYNVPVYLGDSRPNYIDNQDFDYTIKKYGVETHFYSTPIFLKEGSFSIGEFSFDIINVPGHTYCSVVYFFKNINTMFTGDFLFRKKVGIVTSQHSNPDLMLSSIEKIKKYDDDIHIYPGHGPLTILGREKEENPHLI